MRRVAIVGAGVGGLTTALTLSPLAEEVTVYERRTGFGEAGAGIQLSPNASRILVGLGLDGALQRVAFEPDGIAIRDLRSGRSIGTIALGRTARDRFGAPYLHIARADLHTALLDLVRSRGNVRLRVGRSAHSALSGPEDARLVFEGAGGATETVEADLVVGADGIWSRLRESLRDTRVPVYSGFAALRTVVPAANLPAAFSGGQGGLWLGPSRHVVHYPVASGRLVNLVAVERRSDESQGWSVPEPADQVQAAFRDAAPELRSLIAAGETWSRWSLFDLPAGRLGHGRIALVGDAGHACLPFLAQGGALAIEDAAVLAAEIGRLRADIPSAIDHYAEGRLPRVRRVQRQARRNASAYHAAGLVAGIRNIMMRRLGPTGMTERFSWLYDWRPDAS